MSKKESDIITDDILKIYFKFKIIINSDRNTKYSIILYEYFLSLGFLFWLEKNKKHNV